MFLPPHFKEDDVARLHEAIRESRLATLVTYGPEGLIASHIPMLLDTAPEPYGRLIGHVSRANVQWHAFAADVPALAIFLGPEAYVSPSWYATKRQTGKVVPTWNYVAIHVYGTLRVFHDSDRLLDLVTRLTNRQEGGRAQPWAVADAPADYVQAQLNCIVGQESPFHRHEG